MCCYQDMKPNEDVNISGIMFVLDLFVYLECINSIVSTP